MQNELVIIRAPSGFGKSTYAKKHFPNHICCEADAFFMKEGKYVFDRTKLGKAHMWCQETTTELLVNGHNVVVSNTSTTTREVMDYVRIAEACGVPYRVIRLTKEFGNVHNVPKEVVESMKARMQPFNGETVITDY